MSNKEYPKLNLNECAKKFGVSAQVVRNWMMQSRIKFERPATGVVLFDRNVERPQPKTPWQTQHEKDRYSK
jgi:hypothetical protein